MALIYQDVRRILRTNRRLGRFLPSFLIVSSHQTGLISESFADQHEADWVNEHVLNLRPRSDRSHGKVEERSGRYWDAIMLNL